MMDINKAESFASAAAGALAAIELENRRAIAHPGQGTRCPVRNGNNLAFYRSIREAYKDAGRGDEFRAMIDEYKN